MSTSPRIALLLDHLREGRLPDPSAADEIRNELIALTKREETLSAVASTALAIANVLNVADVFAVAIERAKALVRCDVAYLTVFDESTGRSSVRASTGARSPNLNSAQVPLGFGVGGIVAGTRKPFWTDDYLADKSLRHLEASDQITAQEGIRAMAAVPLFARDRLIAILFAADRRVRTYLPEDIAALEALSLVVAVAIENAKLFEAREAAIADIQRAYDSLRKRIATTERVAKMHDKVTKAVATKAPLGELVSALAGDLDAQVVLTDATGAWVAASAVSQAESLREALSSEGARAALRRSIESGSLEPLRPAAGSEDEMLMAVAVGGELYGTLAVFAGHPLVGSERRMIERTGHAAGLLLLTSERDCARATLKRAFFLRDLIEGAEPHPLERAAEFGVDLSGPCTVACLAHGSVDAGAVMQRCGQIAEAPALLCCERAGFVVVLLPATSADGLKSFVERLSERLDMKEPLAFAAVTIAAPLTGLAEAVERAVKVLRLRLASRDASGGFIADDDLDLLSANTLPDLARYRDRQLGALLQYDRENSTELVRTLRQLVHVGMNVGAAASALDIHPKTVAQRMQRISALLGDEWRQPERLFQVQVALRIDALLDPGD